MRSSRPNRKRQVAYKIRTDYVINADKQQTEGVANTIFYPYYGFFFCSTGSKKNNNNFINIVSIKLHFIT